MPTETSRRSLLLTALAAGPALAQQPYIPKQSDRPTPIEGDEAGFASMFDGKSLDGWQGDPKYWRVADGIMTGEITPDTIIKSNTFLIWQGSAPEDFELKVDYRISTSGNSGINYRSVVVPDAVTPANRFAMRGYQCDIDGENRYTGNNYEEKGRLFLAQRGDVTHVTGTRIPIVLSRVGDNKELAGLLRADWNSIHLIIRRNILIHNINGHLMSMTIDDDPARAAISSTIKDGQIGVQVHVGPPMKIEYRNWRIKPLQ